MSKPNSKSTSNVQASNNQQRKPVQTNNNANIYNAQGSRSPTRVQGASTRIAKRQLWWKEPPSEMKIPEAKPFKPVVPTSARIDNNNLGFQPAAYNNAKIETKKLKWNGQPVVDSWSNIKHQPGGGNKEIIDDRVSYKALPKVDCGFKYEFAEDDDY